MAKLRIAIASASLFAASQSAVGQAPTSDTASLRELREFVSAETAAGRFSGTLLVARNGTAILEFAGGLADRRANRASTMDTRFNLASGDKIFTKIAITKLALEGRLAFTDTVGKFLPQYPNATVRQKVTVEQLLRHTSGLGNYWTDAYLKSRTNLKELRDVEALFSPDSLLAIPGSRMAYSNAGYVVLGRIIEVVSGESYRDYVRKHVFEPAGMTRTAYLTTDEWPADKAVGYTASDSTSFALGGNTEARSTSDNRWSLSYRGSSAGGGYSSARDMLKLDAYLRSNRVADSALMRWTAAGPGGRRMLANGGGTGANFEMSRVGEYTIIVLANWDPPAATRILQRAVQLLQGNRQPSGDNEALTWRLSNPATSYAHHTPENARCRGCRPDRSRSLALRSHRLM